MVYTGSGEMQTGSGIEYTGSRISIINRIRNSINMTRSDINRIRNTNRVRTTIYCNRNVKYMIKKSSQRIRHRKHSSVTPNQINITQ